MTDRLTACQNVCQDFGWVVPTAQVLGNLALFLGVVVAYRQLSTWREERSVSLKFDVALELLVLSKEVSNKLRFLRTPFDSIPDDKQSDKKWPYEVRLQRFQDASGLFERLQSVMIRASALLGNAKVDSAVEILFEVRHQTQVAITMLASRSEYRDGESQETKELYERLRSDMWGIYTEKWDPLGMKQLEAVKTLETELLPIIRRLSKP